MLFTYTAPVFIKTLLDRYYYFYFTNNEGEMREVK